MAEQKVAYSVEGAIAHITMDSPKNLNGMDGVMIDQLTNAFNQAAADDAVRAVMFDSSAKAFSGGGDLGAMYAGIKAGQTDFSGELAGAAGVMQAMKQCPKPIVGAINGAAAGAGMILALGCDYVVADENAFFMAAFINVGLIPDTGGFYVMSRALGTGRAMELAITGRKMGLDEAQQAGIVAKVVPADKLGEAAMKMAGRFAAGPTVAYAKLKELQWESDYAGFAAYAEREVKAQIECMDTQDFRDRVIAFIEKK